MHSARVALFTLVILAIGTAPAFADFTAFLGANTTPANRRVQGFALGTGLLLLGFEFEYASSPEVELTDEDVAVAPSLRTGMANVLVQTPFAIFGLQPYATAGAGLFRETVADQGETGLVMNTGGGVKISLAGPLRLRIDYRVLKLAGGARYSPAHRVYAGLNLKF